MSLAILYDSTMCVDCKECERGCAKRWGHPYDDKIASEENISAHKFVSIQTTGDKFSRRSCMHCVEPTCASVCPVGAMQKTALGPVVYDETKCIGCRYCMQACPFQVPTYEWTARLPRVRKCSMCADRQAKGLLTAGAVAFYTRVMYGLGASTNLSDQFPWGIWIGFDILCGVGLAAGGFTLVAVVHIFNIEKYKPILRPTILTAFLGYVLVVCALLFDLGQPQRIWHAMVMWNPHSVMFEVAWCVMLYTTVLALEFAPAVFEKFGWHRGLKAVKLISVPLVILGVILSTLHQSSL